MLRLLRHRVRDFRLPQAGTGTAGGRTTWSTPHCGVLRFTARMVEETPHLVVAMIREALAA